MYLNGITCVDTTIHVRLRSDVAYKPGRFASFFKGGVRTDHTTFPSNKRCLSPWKQVRLSYYNPETPDEFGQKNALLRATAPARGMVWLAGPRKRRWSNTGEDRGCTRTLSEMLLL